MSGGAQQFLARHVQRQALAGAGRHRHALGRVVDPGRHAVVDRQRQAFGGERQTR